MSKIHILDLQNTHEQFLVSHEEELGMSLRVLSQSEMQLINGGDLTAAEAIGIGLGALALGATIASGPVGLVGAFAVGALGGGGGFSIGWGAMQLI